MAVKVSNNLPNIVLSAKLGVIELPITQAFP
jgi:hypothetical protein